LHTREAYGFLDLIGDLGGVLEVLVGFLGFFMMPLSEHSFVLKALNKMFLARTYDTNLFKKPKRKHKKKNPQPTEVPEALKGTEIEQEVQMHYQIKLSTFNSVVLFIYNKLPFLKNFKFEDINEQTVKRLKTLYAVGKTRIEEDLQIERLISRLKEIDHLVQTALMSEEIKF
jgi:hypothetical protein